MKIAKIDRVGTLRAVMEAVMDGGTTPPSVVSMAVPQLLGGDVERMGGPEAIVDWALTELKKRKAITNGDGVLRVEREWFTIDKQRVEVLPKGTRDKLSAVSHAQYQASRVWRDVVRRGQLPARTIENHDLLSSIRRSGFQPELGKIILDENDDIIDGRGRRWALEELGLPVLAAYVQRRTYGEGMEADAHRLADCVAANIGRGLGTATVKAIAARVLPGGGTLDELCEMLGYGLLSMGLKREVALELHETGMSARSIARALGVGNKTVSRWVCHGDTSGGASQNDSETPTRRTKSSDPEIREKVKSLRSLQWNRDEIGEELGLSHGTLTTIDAVIREETARPEGTCRVCGKPPHDCVPA